MAFGLFIHKEDSIYNDSPSLQYQFPGQYLSRASQCVGDWIIYYEPSKVKNTRGYYAVAKLEKIIPDNSNTNLFLAIIEAGSYLDFPNFVPFRIEETIIERGLINASGKISGKAQSAVRLLSTDDFHRILDQGLLEDKNFYPREGDISVLNESRKTFEYERPVVEVKLNRKVRKQAFRRRVIEAYDERCAFTGVKLINGGGRAEVEAAHIKPVKYNGPDNINNGIALSGIAHWMFDRGLISLNDKLQFIISRQSNDREMIEDLLLDDGKMLLPHRALDRPHPSYLSWHRENCFKS